MTVQQRKGETWGAGFGKTESRVQVERLLVGEGRQH